MDLSVVIPAYNEHESLLELHRQLGEALAPLERDYEIIYIDDGSTDETFEVMAGLHQSDPRTKVIQFRRNFGKSAALAVGFAQAQGEIVFTLDADLQDDPAEIPKFLAKLDEGYDFVSGWKHPRHDPLSKTAPSKLANYTIRRTTGLPIHDLNCGFKAMRQQVVEELNLYGELHRYIPVLALWRGFRVAEVQVRHHPRKHGRSKFGMERLARGLFDFITISFLERYTRRPLHFFGWLGVVAFGLGLLINAYMVALKLQGEIIGTRPLLMLGVLLVVVGVQFLSFGLLAEMISSDRLGRSRDYAIRNKLL